MSTITEDQVAGLGEIVRPFIEGELTADSLRDAVARASDSEERFVSKMLISDSLGKALAGTYDELRERAGIE